MKHLPKSKTSPKPPSRQSAILAFDAIGTSWKIDVFQTVTDDELQTLRTAILERIDVFDQAYSRFRQDSVVSEMAQRAGRYRMPDDAKPLLDLYRALYDVTAGCVTPLIGNVLSDAGYDASYSLQPKTLSRPPAWDEVLSYAFPFLTVRQPHVLDFGAAGKGYLVDIIAELLAARGIAAYCIDAGGDMRCYNPTDEPWPVGLENPDDDSEAIGIAQLRNQSLCGSAGNRRAWGAYHHIINPTTLQSPTAIKAVWVVAPSCLVADGLTTALFFVPPSALQDHFTFEYAIVYKDNRLETSSHFPAEFFTNQNPERSPS